MTGNGIPVLIVDDEDMVRSILQDFLEDEGFSADIASNGNEGLELLDANKYRAAIIDMTLPDMNGNTFIEKALAKCPTLCCCIHTGSADYVIPDNLLEKGITTEHVFFKPVQDMTVFSATIKKLIG